jgi:hypothetical protein
MEVGGGAAGWRRSASQGVVVRTLTYFPCQLFIVSCVVPPLILRMRRNVVAALPNSDTKATPSLLWRLHMSKGHDSHDATIRIAPRHQGDDLITLLYGES